MKKSEFLRLTEKFLNGSLTPEEEAVFHLNCENLESRVTSWNAADMDEEEVVRQRVFQNITNRIHAKPAPQAMRLNWRMLAAAAAVVLAVFTGYLFKNGLYDRLFPVEMVSLETANGKSIRAQLPDGTAVWLNAASKLTYPKSFRDSVRRVTLTGEAYFSVAHNAAKPFEINSNGLITRVLGTRFVVKSYPGDVSSKVTVFDGKVRVKSEQARLTGQVTLLPSQQVTVNSNSTEMLVTTGADSLSTMSWAAGKLIYRNTPLPEVLDDLERRFNVKITADKHLETCLIHLDILPGDQLKDVLALLAISLDGKVETANAAAYKLSGKGCD